MRKMVALLALMLVAAGVVMAQDAGGRPFLGIEFTAEEDGALVQNVLAGSPAAEAGLQAGDVIHAVNGAEVTAAELVETIGALAVGEEITLGILRDGAEMELEATLGSAPARLRSRQVFSERGVLGVRLVSDEAGALVEEVLAGSAAEEAGLQAGDVLRSINGEAAATPLEVAALIRELAPGDALTLGIEREGEALTLEAQLGVAAAPGRMPLPEGFTLRAGQPLLGVEYLALNAEVAEERSLTLEEGALILRVLPDTPAEAAGLLAEDIVTGVEGDPVDARRTLRERLLAYEPGETLELELMRAEEVLTLEVTLAEGAGPMAFGFRGATPEGAEEALGAWLEEQFGGEFDAEAWLERFGRGLAPEAWLERFGPGAAPAEVPAPGPDV